MTDLCDLLLFKSRDSCGTGKEASPARLVQYGPMLPSSGVTMEMFIDVKSQWATVPSCGHMPQLHWLKLTNKFVVLRTH